jgi:hypothetical protein
VAALAPNWVSPDSMQEWPEYVRQNTQDKFWMESQPAFHVYDYGANIEIDVTEQLRSMPKERRLRIAEDDSDSGDESIFPAGHTLAPVANNRPEGITLRLRVAEPSR